MIYNIDLLKKGDSSNTNKNINNNNDLDTL